MAKGKRQQPAPQARPSARELWEQQRASIQRLGESPIVRELQRLRDSPLWREHVELDSALRKLRDKLAPPPEPLAKPAVALAKAKRRKPGAGAKQKLTAKEIASLQRTYRRFSRKKPKPKQSEVFDQLRELLRRHVSDRTLQRYVVKPPPK